MATNESSKYKLSVTEGTEYKLSVVDGTELQLSLNGATGATGPANVLTIGTVTTGETGVSAAASITGSSPSQVLNLTLPKGNTGATGATGATGPAGPTGLGYASFFGVGTIAVGTGSKSFTTNLFSTQTAFAVGQRVRVSAAGTPTSYMEGNITTFAGSTLVVLVDVSNGSGSYSSWDISAAGLKGDTGATGPANTLTVASTTTGNAGTSAAVTIAGTSPNQSLSFTIPRGDTGATGATGAAGPNTVTTSTTTNLTGYIFGNGTNISGATAAASAATANTLVIRDSLGAASFTSSAVASGAAVTGTNSSTGIGLSGGAISGPAVYGASSSGQGGSFSSTIGEGSRSSSTIGTGAVSTTSSGTYHHQFGSSSAVERVRGWFVWFFGSFTGRLKTADITADREWTLPDQSGTLTLDSHTHANATTTSAGFMSSSDKTKLNNIGVTDVVINGVTFGRGSGNDPLSTAAGAGALASQTAPSPHSPASTAVGYEALKSNTVGFLNTAVGTQALSSCTTCQGSTAIGSYSMKDAGSGGYSCTAVGVESLKNNQAGENTAIGRSSMFSNTGGTANTATGVFSLLFNVNGAYNSAYGVNALRSNTSGNFNTASGINCLYNNGSGSSNTASGYGASFNSIGSNNSAFGVSALSNNPFSNASGFGSNAQVTGSNQVQLGDSATTTYTYGAVQNRSDIRDKADIVDTTLGLDFISLLRPVDYKWDMREDYRSAPPATVSEPLPLGENPTEDEVAEYNDKLAAYSAYAVERDQWIEASKLSNITHDGSKKRSRYHHGLIAQEVKAVLDQQGIDFGGFQDHSLKDGDDVLSIGYVELIAPMIKAIQELKYRVEELESR